jgi:hypothetical protein
MPLTHLLHVLAKLLCCWNRLAEWGPAFLQTVLCTLLPLVQQLQGCGSLLMQPAAAARNAPTASVQASSSSSSSSCEHQLLCALFCLHQEASTLLIVIDGHRQLVAGVAAALLRLHNDPAVVEMQL